MVQLTIFGPLSQSINQSRFILLCAKEISFYKYLKIPKIFSFFRCHLPLLYIGLENGLTNNSVLAEKFFLQAQAIAPFDPFVSHEMGVIAFQSSQ